MPPFTPLQHQYNMQAKVEDSRRWSVTQSNIADSDLCKNLILIDTVALTATGIIISSKDTLGNLNTASLIMLMVTSILIVLSIIFGVLNYLAMITFHRRWSEVNNRIAERLGAAPHTPNQITAILVEEQKNMTAKSSPHFLYLQIGTLGIALLVYLAMIIVALSGSFGS